MTEHYMEFLENRTLDERDLASTYVLCHPHDHVVPNFKVMEITEVIRSYGEDGGRLRFAKRGVLSQYTN